MNFLRKKMYSLGIDVREKAVAWVEVCLIDSRVQIVGSGFKKMFGSDYLISEWLQLFVKKGEIQSKIAHIAIPATDTIRKIISVSHELNEKDIEMMIQREQKKYFMGIKEELVHDFIVLDDLDENSENQNVLLIGARTPEIDRQKDILKKAKLHVGSIEPDSYSLIRVIEKQYLSKLESNESFLLVDQKDDRLRITIFDRQDVIMENFFVFDRHGQWGENVTQTIRQFKLSYANKIIKKIFVMRGESIEEELVKMARSLNIRVYFTNKVANESVRNELLLAYGLALRGAHGYY